MQDDNEIFFLPGTNGIKIIADTSARYASFPGFSPWLEIANKLPEFKRQLMRSQMYVVYGDSSEADEKP